MKTRAQLVRYLVSGTPGILACEDGRVSFTTNDNEKLFDTPVKEISKCRPSWVGYGSILVIYVGGKKYGFRMADMAAEGEAIASSDLVKQGIDQSAREISAIAKAKLLVKEWCQLLKKET